MDQKLVKMTMLILTVSFLLPSRTTALVPYTRSVFDMMFPPDDPFKILEHNPFAAPRVTDDNALALGPLARADWRETAVEHQISVDVPGMKKGDVRIEVEEDSRVLRVSGERRTEEEVGEEGRWHRAERTVGKFWRQFRLPGNADVGNVRARLEDGVVRIRVPKLVGEKEKEKEGYKVIDIESDQVSGGVLSSLLKQSFRV